MQTDVRPSPPKSDAGALSMWGGLVAGLGFLVAVLAWVGNDASARWEAKASTAAMIGGPFIVAGAVLLAAASIVRAIRGC